MSKGISIEGSNLKVYGEYNTDRTQYIVQLLDEDQEVDRRVFNVKEGKICTSGSYTRNANGALAAARDEWF